MAKKGLLKEKPNHYGLALAFYALGFIYKNFTQHLWCEGPLNSEASLGTDQEFVDYLV